MDKKNFIIALLVMILVAQSGAVVDTASYLKTAITAEAEGESPGYVITYPQLVKNIYHGTGKGNGTVTVGSGIYVDRCIVQISSEGNKAYYTMLKSSGGRVTLTIKGASTVDSKGKSKDIAWSYQIIELYRSMNVAGL